MSEMAPEVLAAQAHLLRQVPQERPRTKHTTEFHSCNIQFQVGLDLQGVVFDYTLVIYDPQESATYAFPFDQRMREVIQESLSALPDIGTTLHEGNGNAA